MDWIEIGKTIADLGLVPALGIACVVLWRKWWAMVDELVEKYEAIIAGKDAAIEVLQERNDQLGEKRLEEYRSMVNDYRDTAEETNRRDEQLATAVQSGNGLLQQLVANNMGGGGASP